MANTSASRGLLIRIATALVDDDAVSLALAIPANYRNHQFIIESGVGVASGAVQPECANVADYAGVWAPLGGGPITVPAASSQAVYNFTGTFAALRVRITTVIGGGSINLYYRGW